MTTKTNRFSIAFTGCLAILCCINMLAIMLTSDNVKLLAFSVFLACAFTTLFLLVAKSKTV